VGESKSTNGQLTHSTVFHLTCGFDPNRFVTDHYANGRFEPEAAVYSETLFLRSDNKERKATRKLHRMAFAGRALGAVPVIEQATKFVITILNSRNFESAGKFAIYHEL
jgi:cytochrome P450